MIAMIVAYASLPSHAAEGNLVRTQGLINTGTDAKAGYLLVNEMKVSMDGATKVLDHRQVPVPVTELKPKRWVYVELEKNPRQKIMKAKSIYVLPYYVNPKNKKDFPFMK